jgi:hypothetical protein
MSIPNESLNLLAKILINVEFFVTDQANQLNYLQEKFEQGSKHLETKIQSQTFKVVEWIEKHEQLQTQFENLLNYLESQEKYTRGANDSISKLILRYKHLEAINKDAIYWKEKAEYYEKTRKILFNQLTKLQDGQKDKFN